MRVFCQSLLTPAAAVAKTSAAIMLIAEYTLSPLLATGEESYSEANRTMSFLFSRIVLPLAAIGLLSGMLTRARHTGFLQEFAERVAPFLAINAKDFEGGRVGLIIAVVLVGLMGINMLYDVDTGWQWHPFDVKAATANGAGGQRSQARYGYEVGQSIQCDWRLPIRPVARLWHAAIGAVLGFFIVHESLDYFWIDAGERHATVQHAAIAASLFVLLAKEVPEMTLGLSETAKERQQSWAYKLSTIVAVLRQGGLTFLQAIVFLEHLTETLFPTDTRYLDLLKKDKVSLSIWGVAALLASVAMADTLILSKEHFANAQARSLVSA